MKRVSVKKLLATVLVLCMCLAALPAMAADKGPRRPAIRLMSMAPEESDISFVSGEPDLLAVDNVPAGATVKVYHLIYDADEESYVLIGQGINGGDTAATVQVQLDHEFETYWDINVTITEADDTEGEPTNIYGSTYVDEVYETIGGSENDPLRITVGDQGSIGAFLWNGSTYVNQYYGDNCWGSNFYYTAGETRKHLTSWYYDDWFSSSITLGIGEQTKPDDNTVQTVWLHENGKLRITQTISYQPGQQYYEKRWKIENLPGGEPLSDLTFIHGGDTTFGGNDMSRSYWNEALNMIYLKRVDVNITGTMGFAGNPSTPATKYFGGYYDDGGVYASETGDLPNTWNEADTDAGYQLQWNKASLRPGNSWEIISYERWTDAGFLQLMPPAGKTVYAGDTVTYQFVAQNFLEEDETEFDLTAVSSNGWTATVASANPVTIPGDGGLANISVRLRVPAEALGLTDTLTLTATEVLPASSSDVPVTQNASVITTVRNTERPEDDDEDDDIDRNTPIWPMGSELTAGDVDEDSVELSWSAARDDRAVVRYRIYANGKEIKTFNDDDLSGTVTGLDPDTEYEFQVEAGDEAGNWSCYGPTVTVRTKAAAAAEEEEDEDEPRTIVMHVGNTAATVDGDPYTLEAPPFIVTASGRTLVPVRFVSEALGAEVQWLEEANQVRITYGGKVIVLTIGSTAVTVDGVPSVIDCAPQIVPPGRTFVPLRFVSETMGADVDYDEVGQQITIRLPEAE